jgi:glycosyltransferase 2 family protein
MSGAGTPARVGEEAHEAAVPAQRQPRVPAWLFTLVKLALSALAISYVAFTVDLAAAWRHMIGQSPVLLAAATVILVGQVILGGLRWHVILASLGARTSAPQSLRIFYIAAFFSNWLWGAAVAGDAMRAWLALQMRLSAMAAISSVILDRAMAVAGVALLVIVTAPLLAARIGLATAASISAAAALSILLGIGTLVQLHRLPLDWQRNRLLRALLTLNVATRTIFLRPKTVLSALGLAAAAQFAMSLSAYLLAGSMSISLSLLDCLVLIQPVVLITALPISIGGWGVRETAMIALLAVAGVPASAALALSVQLGLLSMLAALPGLGIWLRLKRRIDR